MSSAIVLLMDTEWAMLNALNIGADDGRKTENGMVMGMAEYHVGCGAFGIYAGTLNSKNKNLWLNKTECTDEAITAVRDYMVQELLGGLECRKSVSTSGYEWSLKDGRIVELRITVKGERKPD